MACQPGQKKERKLSYLKLTCEACGSGVWSLTCWISLGRGQLSYPIRVWLPNVSQSTRVENDAVYVIVLFDLVAVVPLLLTG